MKINIIIFYYGFIRIINIFISLFNKGIKEKYISINGSQFSQTGHVDSNIKRLENIIFNYLAQIISQQRNKQINDTVKTKILKLLRDNLSLNKNVSTISDTEII